MSSKYDEIRIKVKKDFENKNKDLILKAETVDKLLKENDLLKTENSKLQVENNQCKEWIDRLLGYMDLPEKDFEELKKSLEIDSKLKDSTLFINSFFNKLGKFIL